MPLALFGLSYKTAPLELRERVAFDAAALAKSLPGLTCVPHVREAVVLSTCHRTEIYTELTDVVAAKEHAMSWLADQRGISRRSFGQHVYHRFDAQAVEHLFRVVAGLDSMVLGEAQILGQTREAFKLAVQAGTVKTRLDTTFRWALKVGKRARSETGINRHASSIGTIAADLARKALGSLEGRHVLVIGAGEMSQLATKHLVGYGAAELIVANRTVERLEPLAGLPGVHTIPLSEIPTLVSKADIVITSTGAPRRLISAEMLCNRDRPLVIIDLGVPRDVDPNAGNLPQVKLYNVDQLDEAIAQRQQGQDSDVARVREIVAEELLGWEQWHATLGAAPTVAALRTRADRIRQSELDRTLARLTHLSERDRREVSALAQAITGKLLHHPIQRLKSQALSEGYLEMARELFNLEEQPDGEPLV